MGCFDVSWGLQGISHFCRYSEESFCVLTLWCGGSEMPRKRRQRFLCRDSADNDFNHIFVLLWQRRESWKKRYRDAIFFGVYPRCVWVGVEQPVPSPTLRPNTFSLGAVFPLFWETWASCFHNKVVVENKSLNIESVPRTERKETQKCQCVISGIRTQLTW